ncbi:MAG: DUF3298 and DUF4163 domain-containing protein [Treponema sp.]|jgi:hypothetical protein|nr:DUF3298 and DUF4163 domain-containing protein [Treponema sp.]
MKNFKRFVFLVTVFSVFSLTAACTGGPPPGEEKDKTEFQTKKITVSVLLFPEQISGSPRMNFSLSALNVSGSGEAENFFNVLLYDGQTIDEYKENLIASYRTAYQNMRKLAEERSDMQDQIRDWKYTESMEVRTFSDLGVVISRTKDSYTGGAHGMVQKTYYVADLRKQKALAWNDLFTDPESPELYRLVTDGLRQYAGLKKDAPLSSGIYFMDEPGISDNFFPTIDGLWFHWNPYEIGPYSEGAIEIVIPWDKIRYLLNDEGLVILNQWLRI